MKIELNLFLMYVVISERILCLVSQQLHIFIIFEISDRCFDPSIVSKKFSKCLCTIKTVSIVLKKFLSVFICY